MRVKKKKIRFIVTVDIKSEKEMPGKEMESLAKSIIGRNSCGGASSDWGWYDAEVKGIKLFDIYPLNDAYIKEGQ